jgi:putative endonuclease
MSQQGIISNETIGKQGEALARVHLQGKGFRILESNYRFGRGEIDIIAEDGDTLVFCEVKTRVNDAFGPPEAALTKRKQEQVRKIARGYLYENGVQDKVCRFDVVAIRWQGGSPDIRHYEDAF